jgi:hypothetical protein
MARGTVIPTPLALNSGTVMAAGTINPANGHVVVVADGLIRRTIFQVVNTGGTIGTVSVEPGAYPPAFEGFPGTVGAGGTLALNVPIGGTVMFILEGAKYVQADGQSIFFDFSPPAMQGNIYAYELPQNL